MPPKLTSTQRRVVSISDVTIHKDIMTDSHFPRFFGVVVQREKRSKSSSLYNFWKYRYFKWGSFLNPKGFEFVIFLYIICETFRSKQEEFTKLHVNLQEIWRKFKCRKNRFRPPLLQMVKFPRNEIPKLPTFSTHSSMDYITFQLKYLHIHFVQYNYKINSDLCHGNYSKIQVKRSIQIPGMDKWKPGENINKIWVT